MPPSPEMNVETSGSLDLSGELPPVMLEEPIRGSRAWSAPDLTSEDWTIQFSENALEEIHTIAETIRNHPLPDFLRTPEDFEIPHLREIASSAKSILDQGCGFCVMEPFPLDSLNDQEQVECFRIFSQLLGRPVAQKWDGTMMYDVTDSGQPYSYGVRGSYTNVELPFHNDNAFGIRLPEYVGLLCKRPAREGGVSRFCSLHSVHNRMLEQHPGPLKRLYQPMLFDRQKEHAENAPPTVWAPCFSWNGNQLKARVNVSLVQKGYEISGKKMDDELQDALECLQNVVGSEDLWVEAPLERGQIQFLDNQNLIHYRSRFTDDPDPEKKRHLYRIWLRDSGAQSYDGLI